MNSSEMDKIEDTFTIGEKDSMSNKMNEMNERNERNEMKMHKFHETETNTFTIGQKDSMSVDQIHEYRMKNSKEYQEKCKIYESLKTNFMNVPIEDYEFLPEYGVIESEAIKRIKENRETLFDSLMDNPKYSQPTNAYVIDKSDKSDSSTSSKNIPEIIKKKMKK
jgi:hypothetical protein